MTAVDIILLILLFGMVFWCFNLGILKVLTMIIGMYLGLQVAALTYYVFATLTDSSRPPALTHQIVWFGVLWLVWAIILGLMANQFISTIQLPKALANLDQIGGMLLGTIAALFALLIIGLVFKQCIIIGDVTSGGANGLLRFFRLAFDNSFVMRILDAMRVLFINIMSPWLPANQIPLFNLVGY